MIKSHSFIGPVCLGCYLHNCFSSMIAFHLPLPSLPSLAALFPFNFLTLFYFFPLFDTGFLEKARMEECPSFSRDKAHKIFSLESWTLLYKRF